MNYSFVVHEIGYGHQFIHKLGVLSLDFHSILTNIFLYSIQC